MSDGIYRHPYRVPILHLGRTYDPNCCPNNSPGLQSILDVKPYLKPNTVFEPFTKLENFERAYLDDSHSVCWDIDPAVDSKEVWENLVDLCPDSCYMESVPVANHN